MNNDSKILVTGTDVIKQHDAGVKIIDEASPFTEEDFKKVAEEIQRRKRTKEFLTRAYAFGNKRVREAAGRVLYPEKHKAPKCKECDNACPPGKVCCSAACWKAYGVRTRI
jgi:hypothetical protein